MKHLFLILMAFVAVIFLVSPASAVQPQVAAGGSHTVGLKSDGTVVAVGWNDYGQLNVGTWTNIVQVAAHHLQTIGLKSDGTVVAVGWNGYGQLNVYLWRDIVQVAAGHLDTVGLKSDGTVVAVGDNPYGKLNVYTWTDIVQVATGESHTVGLKSNGTVVAVGDNYHGQLNVGTWTNIAQVATGHVHTVGLKSNGTVVAVGYNAHGQLNVGTWTNIVQVAAYEYHTVGLKSDGTVVVAGLNDQGQLNVGTWTNIAQVATGLHHTVGLKSDGTVVAVGDNQYGQCNTSGWNLRVNSPPVANAGFDQSIHNHTPVTLDGSGSSDPEGNVPLTYAWSVFSQPPGSTAVISNPVIVNPTFISDLPGDYVIQLIVTDSLGAASQPDQVVISTLNSAPIAEAGLDQAITLIGTTVQLDGSQSYDPEGDWITYDWTFASKPSGSNATITSPDTVKPSFFADVYGTYLVRLIVRDPLTEASDTMTVSFENVQPVANAGTSQSARVGETVALDGSGSSDANGDSLTFMWAITSFPAGSGASIGNPFAMTTTFAPDLAGTYVIQLVVNDSLLDSVPSTTQVQAIANSTVAIEVTQDVQESIAKLNPGVLKNATMNKSFNNKLNTVIADIEAGNYAMALDKLQNDILGKTDGCANAGAPDSNDWIKDCVFQGEVYPLILEVIEILRGL